MYFDSIASDGDRVKVTVGAERPVTFEDVVIRVREDFALAMHIDFDEANACVFQKARQVVWPDKEAA